MCEVLWWKVKPKCSVILISQQWNPLWSVHQLTAMLHSHKKRPDMTSTMLRQTSYKSNGFDEARIASYKSELRRLSERFYVRASVGGECGGGVGLRRCFLVRDLRGGVWKVEHRGSLGGLQALRHRPRRMEDGQRMFQKNRVQLEAKAPMVLPAKDISGLRMQSKRARQR